MEEIFNKKINTFWMLCLCVLTVGFYIYYWLISRYIMLRKYLSTNNQKDLIKKSNVLLFVIVFYVFLDLFSFYLNIFKHEQYLQMNEALSMFGAVLLISFSWFFINILKKITEHKFQYNFVMFIIHIFYVNYQINNFEKYKDNNLVI